MTMTLMIAGFNWDAMVLLKATYGDEQGINIAASNWHYGRVLMLPTTQPDQVFATFFADDDDGNLDNGTPNHAIYCEAATNHGFECPEILVGVLFSHTPLNDTTDTENDYLVQAEIFSTEAALDPGTIKLIWREHGGTWQEVVMTDLGHDNLYEAAIPAQLSGQLDYYLYAEDTLGNVGSEPDSAPEGYFDFLVAWQIDTVEIAGAWSAGAPDDNATTGLWEHVDPNGTVYSGAQVQPEDDHTIAGTQCWITGQGSVGGAAGENDVDGGKTTLFSPVIDLTAFDEVTLRYWRWYTNNLGYSPGLDYWTVEISNDAGETWTAVEHTQESANTWVSVTFDLANYFPVPGQVQLKFVAEDAGDGSLVEAGVDDCVIVAFSNLAGVEDGDLAVRLATSLDQNAPNPFNPKTEISFSLRKAGPVSLKIYDVRGQLVRTLLQGEQPAGAQRVIWDGTAADGQPVASGVYFYRLNAGKESQTKKMVLIR